MNAYAVNDWDELEATYFGKNTGTYDYEPEPEYRNTTSSTSAYAPQYIPREVPSRRIPSPGISKKAKEEQRLRRMEILAAHKSKERYVSAKRLKEAMAISLGVVIVAGMFAFLLYRQSQITTLNFQNNALQKSITKTEQETKQIQEDLIANADLTQIRWDAMEKLSMQEPSAKQLVIVKLPLEDQLVTNASAASASGSKTSLAIAKANLAQYYLSLQ